VTSATAVRAEDSSTIDSLAANAATRDWMSRLTARVDPRNQAVAVVSSLSMTEKQQETVRMAIGAVNAWLGDDDMTTLDEYIEGLLRDGHPDVDLQLATGLVVVGGILVRRLAEVKGTSVHDELAAIVRMTERYGGN
jgi:hypothetical protein